MSEEVFSVIWLQPFSLNWLLILFPLSGFLCLRESETDSSACGGEGQYIPTDRPLKPGRDKGRRVRRWRTVEEATNPLATKRNQLCWLAPLVSLPSPPLPPVWGRLICHNVLLPVNNSWRWASSSLPSLVSNVKLDQFSSPVCFSLHWPSGNLVI